MKKFITLYEKLILKKLPLTDQLAVARSILANERTFLSFQRTAVTFVVSGFSFIKFFDLAWMEIVGWLLIPASLVTIILGTFRYMKMKKIILELEHETGINSKK